MYSLTLTDLAEQHALRTPPVESNHGTIAAAALALDDALHRAGLGDTAHPTFERRTDGGRGYVIYDRGMAPVGTAFITRSQNAPAAAVA